MSDINLISFLQKNQKLIELIVKLKDDRDSPLKNTSDYVEEFMQLYEIGWRHSYSILTQYFLENTESQNQFEENLTDLIDKLSQIINYIYKNKKVLSNQYKSYCNCRRNVEKLIDHLSLELSRKKYIEKLYANVFNQAKKSIQSVKNIEKEIKAFDSKVEEAKEESKNLKRESITILGIFSSIIGVLVAGVGLSSAIFANMDDVTSWLLCGLSCLIVMFISNTLFQLFNFIREIADRPAKSSTLLWCFNLVMSGIVVCCLYMNFYFF